jgi:hypothetical protein
MNFGFSETIVENESDFIKLALTYGNFVKSRKDSKGMFILI